MWPVKQTQSEAPVLSLGEFVVVEGRSGVLVPSPPSEERFAVWFGATVGDEPAVELVDADRVFRWDGHQGPVYYH
jgi:hypothetical protein